MRHTLHIFAWNFAIIPAQSFLIERINFNIFALCQPVLVSASPWLSSNLIFFFTPIPFPMFCLSVCQSSQARSISPFNEVASFQFLMCIYSFRFQSLRRKSIFQLAFDFIMRGLRSVGGLTKHILLFLEGFRSRSKMFCLLCVFLDCSQSYLKFINFVSDQTETGIVKRNGCSDSQTLF